MTSTDTHDLGYVGAPFTWSNNRNPSHRILECLDRCLGNEAWTHKFWSSTVQHLPCINSDHCPILLSDGHIHRHRPCKFRFENMWTLQPGLTEVVHSAWLGLAGLRSPTGPHSHYHLSLKLASLQSTLTDWRQHTFGLLSADLRVLERRTGGIQSSSNYHTSAFLSSLECDLKKRIFT